MKSCGVIEGMKPGGSSGGGGGTTRAVMRWKRNWSARLDTTHEYHERCGYDTASAYSAHPATSGESATVSVRVATSSKRSERSSVASAVAAPPPPPPLLRLRASARAQREHLGHLPALERGGDGVRHQDDRVDAVRVEQAR